MRWQAVIALAFGGIALISLATIAVPIFDEVHYLPAARDWLAGEGLRNTEHPLLAKQLMAVGIAMFGDNPWGWRLGSVLFGTLGLFAAMRAVWLASASRFASLATGFLIASSFPYFETARIAMLDIYMLAFAMLGTWAVVAASRAASRGGERWRLVLAGVLFGLAMSCKWSVAPLIGFALPAYLFARQWMQRAGHTGWIETAAWLWGVSGAVYLAHFMTIALLADPPPEWSDPLSWQWRMYELQASVKETHTYMSNWWHWIANWRAIWYYYDAYAGAQRGILFVGHPLTSLAALPALLVAFRYGWRQRRGAMFAAACGWAASLSIWVVAPKPVQFSYHYLLPAMFAMMTLALVLDAFVWRTRHRAWAITFLVATALLFAYFFPVLAGTPLAGKMSFLDYAWLPSWR